MSETCRVRLLAIFAGPHGSGQVGDVRDLPAEVAAEFVDGGYAEYVEEDAEPEAAETVSEPAPAAEESVSEPEASLEEALTEPPPAAEEAPSEPEAQAAPEESPSAVEFPAEAQGI